MGQASTRRRRASTAIKDQSVPISDFGICVIALAQKRGKKPAEWLAQKIGCVPRHANRLIAGSRKVNGRAVGTIVAEILN